MPFNVDFKVPLNLLDNPELQEKVIRYKVRHQSIIPALKSVQYVIRNDAKYR